MDTMRDQARVDPWLESLERSVARRRRRSRRVGPEPTARQLPSYWRLLREAAGRHLMLLITSAAGILTLALLVMTPARSGGVQRNQIMPTAARISRSRGAGRSTGASRVAAVPASRRARSCAMATNAAGYVNPLGLAILEPRRIDQGVDYAGSGKLTALGRGTITNVATATTGWHGTYIEYQLLTGRDAGCYVYYAEGVLPATGLHVGQTVRAGEPVATIIPNSSTGIEVGWAAGQGMISYATKTGQWSPTHEQDNIPSAAGLYFSALIASLGGPPGRVEG